MTGLRAALYLKGVAMGSADAVPGVSGGTIALIVGIYERLIAAVTAVDPARIRRLLAGARPANIPDARAVPRDRRRLPVRPPRGHRNRGRRRPQRRRLPARNASRRDVRLLLRADRGLCGGAFRRRLARHVASEGGRDRGFSLAFLASGYASTALSSSLLVVFVAGAVAVSAMILPGLRFAPPRRARPVRVHVGDGESVRRRARGGRARERHRRARRDAPRSRRSCSVGSSACSRSPTP